MAKAKIQTECALTWRTPSPERAIIGESHVSDEQRIYYRNCNIANAEVLGFCTIYEKTVKGKTIQKVAFDGYESPNADTHICIWCEDFKGRNICFIVKMIVDKFILAIPRNSGNDIVITEDKVLFDDPLDTKFISVEDMEFLQEAIHEWYHRAIANK